MAYLNLEKVNKYYGKHHAIKDVSLAIEQGELIVFVGPSGSGKSTLLRMIAGLEDIDSGELVLEGNAITDTAPAKRNLAMVFQSYALYPHMTVEKNMSFALRLANEDPAHIKDKVVNAAAKLDLTDYLQRTPKQLSGGQRQRVAIGRAIVRQPKVFLFDEPLSNLDAALRGQTRVEIADLHKELNATTIYVTHDQIEAMTLADRVVVLRDGMIEQVGSPLELYSRPANRFVAQFIGMPQMNFLLAEHWPDAPAGAHHVGIRPEHARPFPADEITDVGLTGTVERIEYLGNETLLYIQLNDAMAGQKIIARLYRQCELVAGDEIHLNCAPRHLHFFDEQGQRLDLE